MSKTLNRSENSIHDTDHLIFLNNLFVKLYESLYGWTNDAQCLIWSNKKIQKHRCSKYQVRWFWFDFLKFLTWFQKYIHYKISIIKFLIWFFCWRLLMQYIMERYTIFKTIAHCKIFTPLAHPRKIRHLSIYQPIFFSPSSNIEIKSPPAAAPNKPQSSIFDLFTVFSLSAQSPPPTGRPHEKCKR